MGFDYPLDCMYILENQKRLRRKLLEKDGFICKRIALLSGSTIGDIADILELFLLQAGIKPDFYIGQYNRYYEEAIFDNIKLDDFNPEIIYILTTNKNIDEYPSPDATTKDVDKIMEKQYLKYKAIWESLQAKYHCPVIQNNFELLPYRIMGNADIYMEQGKNSFINSLNNKLYEYARKHMDFHLCDINYLSAQMGHRQWYSSSHWYAYKYAMNIEAIPYLADNVSRIIKSIFGKNKKAIICDLDNTLWGGVIGDDGQAEIKLGMDTAEGMAYMDFQKYLKELRQMGILLVICSKNEIEAVSEGLNHPSSLLDEQDFSVIKANWNEKYSNIKEIISELNLMESGFVFLDDNPIERDSVKAFLPHIAVPKLDDVFTYLDVLNNAGFFEVTGLLNEDIKRSEYYKANIERQNYKLEFKNYQEYLKSLDMTCNVFSFNDDNIARVTQLVNKTNQFNLTTKRYSLSEIQAFASDDKFIAISADLNDRFGYNGIVTSLLAQKIGVSTIKIELWIMSCRVFKRDMEYALFDALVDICKTISIDKIIGVYIKTDRNTIVSNLYQELGFSYKDEKDDETIWEYKIPIDYNKKNKVIEVHSYV